MGNRLIKDAKDLTTNELIYFRGHAKATYMSNGSTVEDAINSINTGGSTNMSNYYTKEQIDAKGYLTNVKTINGISLAGLGNISIGNKTLSTTTATSMSLTPNVYHRNTNTNLSSLAITLEEITDSTILNEYFVEFTTRTAGTTISLPSNIKWVNGEAPTFEANCTYQVSIVNNLGVVTKFK